MKKRVLSEQKNAFLETKNVSFGAPFPKTHVIVASPSCFPNLLLLFPLYRKYHTYFSFFSVPTEFRECGLPEWVANRYQWTSLDSRLGLEMAKESSRRFKLVYKKSRKQGGKQSFSQMTCKKIIDGLGPDEKNVKLVAFQKHGW